MFQSENHGWEDRNEHMGSHFGENVLNFIGSSDHTQQFTHRDAQESLIPIIDSLQNM